MKSPTAKIADLHIHSRFSRACSKTLTPQSIARAAEIKGIDIVGTGDFTHPVWFKELEDTLKETEPGLYALKYNSSKTRFLLSTELSCIYKKGERTRRLHLLVFAPNLETVQKINSTLLARGANLSSDGRPILGIGAKEILAMCLEIDPEILVVPAHAWTPWFSVFGSQSGFDSLEECFEELTPHIHAVETGLSSDPEMNWRLSRLDSLLLMSNSDAHSPANLGREANIIDLGAEPSYGEFSRILKERDKKKFLATIEFFPEEGKYHYDGHRACGARLSPAETKKNGGLCPRCRLPVTLGVMYRVEKLADRAAGTKPKEAVACIHTVPLSQIIADAFGVGAKSKKVARAYDELIKRGQNEFNILLDLSIAELAEISSPEIAEGIRRVRAGEIFVSPGYDGVYGTVKIFNDGERVSREKQKTLF